MLVVIVGIIGCVSSLSFRKAAAEGGKPDAEDIEGKVNTSSRQQGEGEGAAAPALPPQAHAKEEKADTNEPAPSRDDMELPPPPYCPVSRLSPRGVVVQR